MSVKLSRRLQTIADAVEADAKVADVGTDHALLPVYLVQHNRATFAIATDVVPGPIQAARENVSRHQVEARISVRLGDGLQTVQPGEVDTIVIAGMGGGTAVQILRNSSDVVAAAKRLIIQPMNASRQVRTYLKTSSFGLVDEQLIEEEGRIYEILVADVGVPTSQAYVGMQDAEKTWLADEFGPIILRTGGPTLRAYLRTTLDAWRQTLRGLEAGKSEAALERKRELTQHVRWLEQWWEENCK